MEMELTGKALHHIINRLKSNHSTIECARCTKISAKLLSLFPSVIFPQQGQKITTMRCSFCGRFYVGSHVCPKAGK